MTDAVWPPEFESVLRPLIPLLPADKPLTPHLQLTDAGLDSMATVTLLVELEDAFDVRFPDEMLQASTVSTPAGLWAAVDSLLAR